MVISVMKLAQITLVFIIIAMMCIVAAALPNLDYLTEDDCRNCHGDEYGNTQSLHHMNPDFSKCTYCHTFPLKEGWRSCDNCHGDFDHHENAKGRCAECHDKQHNKQHKKGSKH
jgi:hypothetical protein